MVARYRSVLSVPGFVRVFSTALIGRLPQGMTSLAILLLVRVAHRLLRGRRDRCRGL